MKKILSGLVLLSLLFVLVTPMMVSAIDEVPSSCTLKHAVTNIDLACTKGATVNEAATGAWGMCCMLDAVMTVTDWIFIVLIVFVALMVLLGGFTIATAAGAPEKVTTGRNYIIYACAGLAVALLAKAIPAIVIAILGV